ncbi:serpin-ZXA [Physcomitrium patens]|uniref:Serpin domain-containing protein n=1 Tax=Physcomitrium patens TaxID=3218 RepID=A9SJW0_PHYPA|nr:serpin-ZXA-like [Physcomitrium patens]PNR62211.1 hypothetical protein PHYPA_000635 [Physcomitrium patens]|eukprot:XP_024390286.1 serpin-ZXA-like [Physcomitrella patens]
MGLDVEAMVHGQTEFTIDLYKAVVKGKETENAVLSPVCISLALAMVSAGAKGPTREQIAKCIKLPEGEPMHNFSSQVKIALLADGSGAGGPQLSLANRIWVEQSVKLKLEFQKVLKDSYGSEAASVDFRTKADEARGKVNEWAKEETHGKIEDLLPPGSVDQGTHIVLANALYFKGAWKKPFEEKDTKDGEFFLLDGKSIKVPMMHTTKKQYVKDFSTFKALRLPYSSGHDRRSFSMFILLPHEKNGITEFEKSLDFKTLAEDLSKVNQEAPMNQFALPKFKISFSFEVPEALQTLGLSLPFGEEADLTEMVDSSLADKLFVSNLYHKTFVDVNEKGTEAAAATAATITLKGISMFQDPIDFICDHPFLFVIKEEVTNVIIFTGRITDPSVEK